MMSCNGQRLVRGILLAMATFLPRLVRRIRCTPAPVPVPDDFPDEREPI